MAKTIKFNLVCDGNPIRTIEDLQNNFVIEDVLDYYNNKLLHRWLKVRGYDSELELVSKITSKDTMQIIKQLIRIFNIASDNQKMEESIYILKYFDERKKRNDIYANKNFSVNQILKDYQAGYQKLINGILENPNNAAIIKSNLSEIVSHYAWIFELNHRALFYNLKEKSVLAIMCLLMNEKCRNYYLPVMITEENGTITHDTEKNTDKRAMFVSICQMIKQSDFASNLNENLITFSGVTDGYWKDLEPAGKRYMIISMGDGDYVRCSGVTGGDLSSSDILNKFVILNGVDYKSNSNNRKLLYMEV